MSSPTRPPAALLFGLLVAATLTAFVLVEDERDHPKIIENDRVTPPYTEECPDRLPSQMEVRFTITRGEQDATVVVIDEEDRVVKTLATDKELVDDGTYTFRWDATDDDGEPVSPGRYRLRLQLGELGRDLPLPSTCVAGAAGGRAG